MTTFFSEDIKRGLFYGAIGDGLGYQVEFIRHERMPEQIPVPEEIIVSDDTQMALALAQAISSWSPGNDTSSVRRFWSATITQFLTWMDSPENNRAPGTTCMGSLRSIQHADYNEIIEQTVHEQALTSTGSGAVMRVFPSMAVPAEYRYAVAWAQAIATHSDPRAAVAAMMVVHAAETITATGSYHLEDTRGFLEKLDYPESFVTTRIPTGAWRDSLALASTGTTEDSLRGLGEYLEGIHEPDDNHLTLHDVIDNGIEYVSITVPDDLLDPEIDVANIIGAGGWDSVSGVGIALLGLHLVLSSECDAVEVMNWLMRTGGDSDTVATVFGHLYGFATQNDWFDDLIGAIEPVYRDEIEDLGTVAWDRGY